MQAVYARLERVVDQRDAAERAVGLLERCRTDNVAATDAAEYTRLTGDLAEALAQASDAYARLGLHHKQRDACLRELQVFADIAPFPDLHPHPHLHLHLHPHHTDGVVAATF